MNINTKKFIAPAAAYILFACVFIALAPRLQPLRSVNRYIYDTLIKLRYKVSAAPSPAAADILLVTIDNRALSQITQRWPYERALFARAIENLRKSGARIIAFDFAFFGKSTPQDDAALANAIGNGKVILATTMDEEGHIIVSGLPPPAKGVMSGFITKLKDKDGVVRSDLVYLVSEKDPKTGFLSWSMQILKAAKGVDVGTLKYTGRQIVFDAAGGEKLKIPVASGTKSFLINFRYHTKDFKNISFYDVVNGGFDPRLVKNKIVLVGMTSSLLADVHNTALGWLPGVTLNANAFLTLYAKDFLKRVPRFIQAIFILCGIMAAAAFVFFLKPPMARRAVFMEIFAFFALSFLMLLKNLVHNYALLPIGTLSCLFLKKMLDITEKMWFNITKQRGKEVKNMAKANNKYIRGLLCLVAAFMLASCSGGKNLPISITMAKTAIDINDKLMPVKPTTAFPKDTRKVFCWFKWKNAVINSQITASWHYVTDDIHILDYTFVIPRKEGSGSVSLVMPQNKTLPSGSYRLDLKAGGRNLRTLIFSVKG